VRVLSGHRDARDRGAIHSPGGSATSRRGVSSSSRRHRPALLLPIRAALPPEIQAHALPSDSGRGYLYGGSAQDSTALKIGDSVSAYADRRAGSDDASAISLCKENRPLSSF
jgi:hypothetical protein